MPKLKFREDDRVNVLVWDHLEKKYVTRRGKISTYYINSRERVYYEGHYTVETKNGYHEAVPEDIFPVGREHMKAIKARIRELHERDLRILKSDREEIDRRIAVLEKKIG